MQEPRSVLAVIDDLHRQFGYLLGLAADSTENADLSCLGGTRNGVDQLLALLKGASEHRGIDCTPLIQLATRWEELWDQYPKPEDAIRHLLDVLPEDWLLEKLQPTSGRLRVLVLLELVRSPPPVRQELRRIAKGLRGWADEELSRDVEIGLLGQSAITACTVGGFAVCELDLLREAIEPAAQANNADAAAQAVLDWLRARGFSVDFSPGSAFLGSIAAAFESLSEDVCANAVPAASYGGIKLFVERQTATLDGRSYELTERGVEILCKLTSAAGNWVSGRELVAYADSSERPGRIIKRFPQPIRALIESKQGTGYRLMA